MDAVGYVLAQREQDRFPWGIGAALALLLHAVILAAVLISSLSHAPRYLATRAVAVRLVQAGSIKGGASVSVSPPSEPEKPRITKPAEEEPPPPSKKAVLLPAKEEKKPPPTAPQAPGKRPAAERSQPSDADRRGQGGPVGAGGNVGIGGATFDQPDFNYSYYIERMLVTIGVNWFKPTLTVQNSPVIRFRILRDGTITDAEVERSSGLAFVDRAALRAVLASSPLPPLPSEFGGPQLGVHLIFE
jgi:periplasmic protein TonB